MRPKKLAFFTFIRSEYGSLSFLLDAVRKSSEFNYDLIVGGAHLSEQYGNTINEIVNDGFEITKKINFLKEANSIKDLGKGLAILSDQLNDYFSHSDADLIFLLGDRYELLPVATMALLYGKPIAHVSGGEITEGAIDNQVRHAVSKMASIHFVATDDAKSKLINLAECEQTIHVTGELGLDFLSSFDFMDRKRFLHSLDLDPAKKICVITFHPETILGEITPLFLADLFTQLFTAFPEYEFLATAANFDPEGSKINELLMQFASANQAFKYVASLGKHRYYNLLKHADLVLGNSSSGIYEVQSFKIPVVNVGNRQKGRLSNPNVVHSAAKVEEVIQAIHKALSSDFKQVYYDKENIYAKGKVSENILAALSTLDFETLKLKKDCLSDN